MTELEHSSPTEPSLCVLVVDDNPECRQMLSLALETAGFTVLAAGSPLEAQRHLAHTRPDVLVLDLQRSETDGLDMVARLRARQTLRDVPILFLAGSQDQDFRWQARLAGADWFGLRPLSLSELRDQIRRLIGTTGGADAHSRQVVA